MSDSLNSNVFHVLVDIYIPKPQRSFRPQTANAFRYVSALVGPVISTSQAAVWGYICPWRYSHPDPQRVIPTAANAFRYVSTLVGSVISTSQAAHPYRHYRMVYTRPSMSVWIFTSPISSVITTTDCC